MTTRLKLFAVVCLAAAVVMGATGLGISLHGAQQTANNTAALRTLLLDGKTSSAMSAKQTAKEVRLLLFQQQFDHQQSQNGQKVLQRTVRSIEAHIDATIRTAITREAARFAARLKQ